MSKPRVILAGLSNTARHIVSLDCVDVVEIWDEYPSAIGTSVNGVEVKRIPDTLATTACDYVIVTGLLDKDLLYRKLSQINGISGKLRELMDSSGIFASCADFYSRLVKYKDDWRQWQEQMLLRGRQDQTVLYPMLFNWDAPAGTSTTQYFHQDLWAARKIYSNRPAQHFDIGSRVDGFILACLAFVPVTMIDIRPLPQAVDGLAFIHADATELDNIADNSIESMSSLCAIEHFGMGGYGGDIDFDADKKVCASCVRVLKPNGRLYVSVPVGRDAVAFNAHRFYSPHTFISYFPGLSLTEFSVARISADGLGIIETNADMDTYITITIVACREAYLGYLNLLNPRRVIMTNENSRVELVLARKNGNAVMCRGISDELIYKLVAIKTIILPEVCIYE